MTGSTKKSAGATEDERVAPLKPYDAPALPGGCDHRIVNRSTALGMLGRQFRHAHAFSMRRRVFEQRFRNEMVVKNEIGLAKTLDGAQGDQPGMARAGADQRNMAE